MSDLTKTMRNTLTCLLFTVWLCSTAALAADQPTLNENRFQDNIRSLTDERTDSDRLHRAKEIASTHLLSSLQVKALAARLSDDAARLDFALVAYPQTVDPENFYEVYDAFTTFSKVMRLHDRIKAMSRPSPKPVARQGVSEEELKSFLSALHKEAFDQTRLQLARQFISSNRQGVLAAQVKQMMDCLDFEPSKLDLAKYAYSYTLDQNNYFVVNEGFSFISSKDALARYIQSQPAAR
jgi:hypothetical protein